MAARHGDDGPGGVDARTWNDVLVYGALEAEAWTAEVAHRGEPAHERVRRLGARYQIEVAEVACQQGRDRRPNQHRMPVHVDQPGHQRASVARDDPGVSAIGCNRIA